MGEKPWIPFPCPLLPQFSLRIYRHAVDSKVKRQNSAPSAWIFWSGVCRGYTPVQAPLLVLSSLVLIPFCKLLGVYWPSTATPRISKWDGEIKSYFLYIFKKKLSQRWWGVDFKLFTELLTAVRFPPVVIFQSPFLSNQRNLESAIESGSRCPWAGSGAENAGSGFGARRRAGFGGEVDPRQTPFPSQLRLQLDSGRRGDEPRWHSHLWAGPANPRQRESAPSPHHLFYFILFYFISKNSQNSPVVSRKERGGNCRFRALLAHKPQMSQAGEKAFMLRVGEINK